ncbi:MAG: hypothetical protein SOI26_00220 [Coriobacteriales bacterium]
MRLLGDNSALGHGPVQISETRSALPVDDGHPPFPRGVGGLVPVVTQRRKKPEKTSYAFALDPSVPGIGEALEATYLGMPMMDQVVRRTADADAGDAGGGETPAGSMGAADDARGDGADAGDARPDDAQDGAGETGDAPSEPARREAREAGRTVPPAELAALARMIALVNRLLMQARELSGHRFGFIDAARVGVPAQGWGFTRVESVEFDAHGNPSSAPTRLYIETAEEPGGIDSIEAVVDIDLQGDPQRVQLSEVAHDRRSCRVVATVNEKSGKLSVYKVEEGSGRGPDSRLLYKRNWQPRERDGRDDRDARDYGRGRDRGEGWDDGRAGERFDVRDGRGGRGWREARDDWDDRDGDRGWRGGRGARDDYDGDRGRRGRRGGDDWGDYGDRRREDRDRSDRGWRDDRHHEERRDRREGRSDRYERSDRYGRDERYSREDGSGREGRSDRGDRYGRDERRDRYDRYDSGDRSGRYERPDRYGGHDGGYGRGRSDRSGDAGWGRPDRGDRPGSGYRDRDGRSGGDRYGREGRTGRYDRDGRGYRDGRDYRDDGGRSGYAAGADRRREGGRSSDRGNRPGGWRDGGVRGDDRSAGE